MNIVSTGEVIKTYLEANDVNVLSLAEKCKISARTIIRVLNDESKLPYELAVAINQSIPEISVDFLVSYDAVYQATKKRFEKENTINDVDEIIKEYKLKKLYKEYSEDKFSLFNIAKTIFGIDNIKDGYAIDVNDLKCCFSLAKNSDERTTQLWLKTAYEEYQLSCNHNPLLFDSKSFQENFKLVKQLSNVKTISSILFNMKELCKETGINFYYRPSIPNSRIRAVSCKDNRGYIYIFVSDLFKCVENLWLSFVHELIHISNNDFETCQFEVIEDNENYVDEKAIEYFVGSAMKEKKKYSISEILDISFSTKTPVGIVAEIARSKSKFYSDYEINSYVHYYKSADVHYTIPLALTNESTKNIEKI